MVYYEHKKKHRRIYNIKVVSETKLNTILLNCPVCGTFKAFEGGDEGLRKHLYFLAPPKYPTTIITTKEGSE